MFINNTHIFATTTKKKNHSTNEHKQTRLGTNKYTAVTGNKKIRLFLIKISVILRILKKSNTYSPIELFPFQENNIKRKELERLIYFDQRSSLNVRLISLKENIISTYLDDCYYLYSV